MAAGDSFQTAAAQGRSVGQAWRYLWRAMRLKCPVCGTRPIFIPWYRVRSFHDWFTPLDGCPRCGYPYEREPGYFLLAVFGFNPGFAVFVATVIFIYLAETDQAVQMPAWQFMCVVGLPVPIINIIIARHAKALFVALDHFVDPHVHDADDGSDDDDDDGIGLLPDAPAGSGSGINPDPVGGDDGGGHPWPEEEGEAVGAGSRGRETVPAGR